MAQIAKIGICILVNLAFLTTYAWLEFGVQKQTSRPSQRQWTLTISKTTARRSGANPKSGPLLVTSNRQSMASTSTIDSSPRRKRKNGVGLRQSKKRPLLRRQKRRGDWRKKRMQKMQKMQKMPKWKMTWVTRQKTKQNPSAQSASTPRLPTRPPSIVAPTASAAVASTHGVGSTLHAQSAAIASAC